MARIVHREFLFQQTYSLWIWEPEYVSPTPTMSMLTKNTCHFQFQIIKTSFSWHVSLLLALFSFLYPALNRCRSSHLAYNPLHSVLICLLTLVLCLNKSNSVAGITSGPCYITVQASQALCSKWNRTIKELLLCCVMLWLYTWTSDFWKVCPSCARCSREARYLLLNSPRNHLCFHLIQYF